MKKFIFLLIVLCYASCKSNEVTTARSFTNETDLTSYIDSCFAKSKVPGISLAALDENGVIFQRSFGYADIARRKKFTEETIINIASISKTVIAVAMMKAVDEGYVDLDEDINSYLPFKVVNPYHQDKKTTLRHLATHTSSIVDSEVYAKAYYFYDADKLKPSDLGKDFAEYFEYVKENDLIDDSVYLENVLSKDGPWYDEESFSKKAPGEEADYSNIAASLAALVIESATNMTYEDYTTQKIFEPLGMESSVWKIDERTEAKFAERYFDMKTKVPSYYLITKADGGLYTSVSDFSKYMQEMIKGYKGQGTILSEEGYKTMFSEQWREGEDQEYYSGIFWNLPRQGVFGHDGGDPGVTTRTSYNGEKRRSLIFFCNVEATKESMPDINKIWNAVGLYNFK